MIKVHIFYARKTTERIRSKTFFFFLFSTLFTTLELAKKNIFHLSVTDKLVILTFAHFARVNQVLV